MGRCICKNDLPEDGRIVTLVSVKWGDQDPRPDWEGPKSFCSFGCLSDWANEKAAEHDAKAAS